MISAERITRASRKLSDLNSRGNKPWKEKEKSGRPTSDVYHSSWKWYKMLKFLVIVHNATKGFDTMKTIKVTEDDQNECPATVTPNEDDQGRLRPKENDTVLSTLYEERPCTWERSQFIIKCMRSSFGNNV